MNQSMGRGRGQNGKSSSSSAKFGLTYSSAKFGLAKDRLIKNVDKMISVKFLGSIKRCVFGILF